MPSYLHDLYLVSRVKKKKVGHLQTTTSNRVISKAHETFAFKSLLHIISNHTMLPFFLSSYCAYKDEHRMEQIYLGVEKTKAL